MRFMNAQLFAFTIVMLAGAVACGTSAAPEAPPFPAKDSTTPQASKPNTPRIENPQGYVGQDVNSFAKRVNSKQQDNQDNAVSCPSCDLVNADLSGANLTEANLTGAKLDGVLGANFTGALNVPEKYLKD